MDHLNRRELLLSLAGAALGATLSACQFPAARVQSPPTSLGDQLRGKKRPNILLIVTDQEFHRLPRPAGFSLPNREWLKERGVTFNNYYTTTAPCTPSRATIFTGQHVPLTRMFDNINFPYVGNLPIQQTLPTVGNMLSQADYYCAYKGKWHLTRGAGSEMKDKGGKSLVEVLKPYGFKSFNPMGDFHGNSWTGFLHDPEIAQLAEEWLTKEAPTLGSDQPWFLTVGFVNPHDVMFADNNVNGEKVQTNTGPFKIKTPPEAPQYKKDWRPDLPSTLHASLDDKPRAHKDYQRLMDLFFGPMPTEREDMYRANLNYYLNCLLDVDQQIGRVLKALEQSGQADNTIILFTADHGDMMGAHGLRQKGPLIYKENLNVPLVVVHPDNKGKAGTTCDALVSSLDLTPTLLGFGGLSREMRMSYFPFLKGYDFGSVVTDPTRVGERAEKAGAMLFTYDSLNSVDVDFMSALTKVVDEGIRGLELTVPPALRPNFEKRGFLRGMFDGRYKFARYFGPVRYNRPRSFESLVAENDLELYDVQADPEEKDNLAAKPETQKELITQLNFKLEALITVEIGDDTTIDLPELPKLRPMQFQT